MEISIQYNPSPSIPEALRSFLEKGDKALITPALQRIPGSETAQYMHIYMYTYTYNQIFVQHPSYRYLKMSFFELYLHDADSLDLPSHPIRIIRKRKPGDRMCCAAMEIRGYGLEAAKQQLGLDTGPKTSGVQPIRETTKGTEFLAQRLTPMLPIHALINDGRT